jgi:hypothetical protein
MLKSRAERLAEETGLVNGQEQAMAFVKALPAELRQWVEPVLWAQSPSGVYSLRMQHFRWHSASSWHRHMQPGCMTWGDPLGGGSCTNAGS